MTHIYSGKDIYAVEQGSGGNPYITPMVDPNARVGDIRYNSISASGFEVYNGSMWIPIIQNSYSLNLSPEVQQALDWAKKKMSEEAELEKMMSQHPGVRAAWEQLEIMKRLCQETESQ